MKFNPEEAVRLIEEGETDIKVVKSIDHISQESKKESFKLTIQAWDKNGKEGQIVAYVSLAWQIKAVCECLGVSMDKFNSGEIEASEFEGLSGKAMNRIEKSTNPHYEDKNVIAKWLKKEAQKAPEAPAFDDDIPF